MEQDVSTCLPYAAMEQDVRISDAVFLSFGLIFSVEQLASLFELPVAVCIRV